ncbi:mariner transposase [Trichonephila clavipes]|nr:mariner transposase [Trichonephila clavipes]
MMDRISICEALGKRNEINPFLKRMVTRNKKWVTYDNIMRKRSWSKRGDSAQTVAKQGLMARKGTKRNIILTQEEILQFMNKSDSELTDLSNDDYAVDKTFKPRILEGKSCLDESDEEKRGNICSTDAFFEIDYGLQKQRYVNNVLNVTPQEEAPVLNQGIWEAR